jgi:class 3 adenylate cyclase/tetratricopeptide (TPR) repeat protein
VAPEARFCGECGARLTRVVACPECAAENLASQKFCSACGHALAQAPAPVSAAAHGAARAARRGAVAFGDTGTFTRDGAGAHDPRAYTPTHLAEKILGARAELDGEHKQVTVLFADVVGSMDLAEQTDPETWRAIMERFFVILCDGVHRFEGTVDKFTGDGIMALFGAPVAHEDHAQRACWAALSLQRELAAYAAEVRREEGLGFSVRMGINSGEVVVGAIGDDLRMEYTAIGHTVGLAQRMESLAEPGKAYLTGHTAKLVAGYLDLDDLGELKVKGAASPVRVHALTGAGAARTRLDISRARGFTRFVGREDELATLEAALEQARDGSGVVVGIVGEAGVGKSRLCNEFAERARKRGIPVYEAQGQAHGRAIPFLPVLQMMRSYFGISEQDSDQQAREKIAGRLLLLDAAFADDLPVLFDFLAVPDPQRPAPRMDPDARQRALLAMIKRLVHAASQQEPGVNLLEDAHWIDPGTEVFLSQLIEVIPGTRNLTVLNFRPEYSADWMRKSYYRQVSLLPLGEEAIAALLEELLGSDPSLNGLPALIRERSAGNPFFIEELVRAFAETGNLEGRRGAYRLVRPVEQTAIPPTVNAVLAARIDRLGEREKALLQSAAVIGTELARPVLERVAPTAQDQLEPALRALIAGELLYEQELYPEPVYAFRHPLTQEVAYRSQLGERRASVHRRVAEAIDELYPDKLDERAALIAQHWEAAGDALAAARWSARAAAWAGLSDIAQAVAHWRKVSELLEGQPDCAEATALALGARLQRLDYGWRLGITEQEAAAHYEAGRELALRAGDQLNLAILTGLYATVRGLAGHVEEYVELGDETMRLADETGDPNVRMAGLGSGMYSRLVRGRLAESLALTEEAIALGDQDPRVGSGLGLICPYAWSIMLRAWLLALMGYREEPATQMERAMRVAREHEDLETIGFVHGLHVWLAHLSGETAGVMAHGTQAYEIGERIGDSFSRALGVFYLGWAHSLVGEPAAAVPAIEESIARSREARTGLEQESLRLAALAEALLATGQQERALHTAQEAIAVAREHANESGLPWSYRVLAEVHLAAGGKRRAAAASEALDRAAAAVELTGLRAELPFIERVRAQLIPAG